MFKYNNDSRWPTSASDEKEGLDPLSHTHPLIDFLFDSLPTEIEKDP